MNLNYVLVSIASKYIIGNWYAITEKKFVLLGQVLFFYPHSIAQKLKKRSYRFTTRNTTHTQHPSNTPKKQRYTQ